MFKAFLRTPFDESDLFLAIGTGLLFFGLYQMFPPSAYIVTGLIFIGLAWLQAPKPLPQPKECE